MRVAGTIFGAAAGGLIGSAVSHGNGGAVIRASVLAVAILGTTMLPSVVASVRYGLPATSFQV